MPEPPDSRRPNLFIRAVLLGALLNIIIAWCCALWSPSVALPAQMWQIPAVSPTTTALEVAPDSVVAEVPLAWRIPPEQSNARLEVTVTTHRGFGLSIRDLVVEEVSFEQGTRQNGRDASIDLDVRSLRAGVVTPKPAPLPLAPAERRLVVLKAGWPFESFRAGVMLDTFAAGAPVIIGGASLDRLTGALLPAAPRLGRRPVPLTPLLAGFIANTAIFAAALWLTFTVARVRREKIRTRLDLCPNCAYPAKGLDACPECGNPFTTRP